MSILVSWVPLPENSGAGGSGRLGLPPYRELGVPGRGLPLMSARSYCEFDALGGAGGRAQSERDGLHGRVGEDGRDEYD